MRTFFGAVLICVWLLVVIGLGVWSLDTFASGGSLWVEGLTLAGAILLAAGLFTFVHGSGK